MSLQDEASLIESEVTQHARDGVFTNMSLSNNNLPDRKTTTIGQINKSNMYNLLLKRSGIKQDVIGSPKANTVEEDDSLNNKPPLYNNQPLPKETENTGLMATIVDSVDLYALYSTTHYQSMANQSRLRQ